MEELNQISQIPNCLSRGPIADGRAPEEGGSRSSYHFEGVDSRAVGTNPAS